MARRGDSKDLAATVTLLRALRGWSKKQLAEASGVDKSRISRYELGRETPAERTLERLAAAAGLPAFLLEPMRCFIHRLRESTMAGHTSGAVPAALAHPQETKGGLGEALDRAVCQARAELKLYAERSSGKPGPPVDAEILWERLKPFSAADRRLLVQSAREYQDPSFCERLCAESLQASAADAEEARELAELAVIVAEHADSPRAWSCRLQGYAWAFVANAHRAANDPAGARTAWARAGKLWQEGDAGDPDPGGEAHRLHLGVSLCRLPFSIDPPS